MVERMITDDELIAEFMGGYKQIVTNKKEGGYKEGTILWHGLFGEQGVCTYLDFDTSWDWLMPVVEKIETIKISTDTTTYNFQIHKTVCKIWEPYENKNPIIYIAEKTKIKAAYKAVVEFIKWYNSQPK